MYKSKIMWLELLSMLLGGILPSGASAFIYAPCCLSVVSVSQTEIDLSWIAVAADPSPTGYTIERSDAGGFFYAIARNINAIAYADTNLMASTNYTYRVSAVNALDGTGPASQPASVYTQSPPAIVLPERPSNLTAKITSISEIDLNWIAATSVYPIWGYKIEKESPYGGGFTTLVQNTSTTATTYADTAGLNIGTTYNYRVSAINQSGTGPASIPADATVPSIPDSPRTAKLTPGDGMLTVSWSPPLYLGGGITGYIVGVLGSATTTEVTGTTTSTTLDGLINGTSYTVTIRAKTLAGVGRETSAGTASPNATAQIISSPAVATVFPTSTPSSTVAAGTGANQPSYLFTANLWRGLKGVAVTELQKRLQKEGFFSDEATGYYGYVTEASVRLYQKAKGIMQTGTLGPLTRGSLNKGK